MSTPIRWQRDESRLGRVCPPLADDHPLAGLYCPACAELLGNGEPVQLLALGPGADAEARERHKAGRWYSAEAIPVHAACLGTEGGA